MIFKNQKIDTAALFNTENYRELPSCGIEDVDRSVFKLFSEVLPFFYEENGNQKRFPAIFASGERAVILNRRKPLRDAAGALIIPLISILRRSIEQDPENYGISPTGDEIVIDKKIYSKNLAFKEQINENGLENQDNVTKDSTGNGAFSKRNFSMPGSNINFQKSKRNIFEIYTMPTPRFFTTTYEITFWTTTQVQMNSVIETLLSLYNTPARQFHLETDKGYSFTALVSREIDTEDNVDGMNDSERILKSTIIIEVNAYVINSSAPGLMPAIKKYVTAPKLTFETVFGKAPQIKKHSEVSSNNPDNYIEEAWAHEEDPLPGSALGTQTEAKTSDVTIGKTNKMVSERYFLEQVNPQTGKKERVEYIVKDSNHRKGELVLREVKVL